MARFVDKWDGKRLAGFQLDPVESRVPSIEDRAYLAFLSRVGTDVSYEDLEEATELNALDAICLRLCTWSTKNRDCSILKLALLPAAIRLAFAPDPRDALHLLSVWSDARIRSGCVDNLSTQSAHESLGDFAKSVDLYILDHPHPISAMAITYDPGAGGCFYRYASSMSHTDVTELLGNLLG